MGDCYIISTLVDSDWLVAFQRDAGGVLDGSDLGYVVPSQSYSTKGIHFLDLTARAVHAMNRLGVHDPQELSRHHQSDLLGLKNCGTTTIRELKLYLASYGLRFLE